MGVNRFFGLDVHEFNSESPLRCGQMLVQLHRGSESGSDRQSGAVLAWNRLPLHTLSMVKWEGLNRLPESDHGLGRMEGSTCPITRNIPRSPLPEAPKALTARLGVDARWTITA